MKKNNKKNSGMKAALILTAALAFAAPAATMIHTQNVMACDYGNYDTTNTKVMTVCVSDGYLTLRSSACNDPSNEIGRLYNGYLVNANIDDINACNQFVHVYCASLDKSGYVNVDYLVDNYGETDDDVTMTVRVDDGFLALRNACDDTAESIVGRLYSGDIVTVSRSDINSGYTYWEVYAPSLGMRGYVNSNYLR